MQHEATQNSCCFLRSDAPFRRSITSDFAITPVCRLIVQISIALKMEGNPQTNKGRMTKHAVPRLYQCKEILALQTDLAKSMGRNNSK